MPMATGRIHPDGSGIVQVGTTRTDLPASDPEVTRRAILSHLVTEARRTGAAVLAQTTDPDQRQWRILVHPDGRVLPAPKSTPSKQTTSTPEGTATSAPDLALEEQIESAQASTSTATPLTRGTNETPPAVTAPGRIPKAASPAKPSPSSVIKHSQGTAQAPHPVKPVIPQGWGEVVEDIMTQAEASDLSPLLTPMTAVLSKKGRVGKTTTTVCLGARHGDAHQRTILIDADHHGTLADRVPLKAEGPFTGLREGVVWSFASLRWRLGGDGRSLYTASPYNLAEFELSVDLATRFADQVIVDCHTDVDHVITKTVLARATRCVIVVDTDPDALQAGRATLETLRSEHPSLASSAIFVVCQRAKKPWWSAAQKDPFPDLPNPVVVVPHDPHLRSGGSIDQNQLRRRTRVAYEHLASLAAISPKSGC